MLIKYIFSRLIVPYFIKNTLIYDFYQNSNWRVKKILANNFHVFLVLLVENMSKMILNVQVLVLNLFSES